MDNLKLWQLEFEAHYLGGVAIVIAPAHEEAIETAVKSHPELEPGIRHASVTQVMIPKFPAVLYFDNGDY